MKGSHSVRTLETYALAKASFCHFLNGKDLPIIKKCNGKERNQYRSAQGQVNEALRILSDVIGLHDKLTMYVACHSWASIAQSLDIPIDIISKGMGHASQKTTHIYLKDIDDGKIDEANLQVMNLI